MTLISQDGDWKQKTLKPKTRYPNLHLKFGEVLDDNGLTQIVEEPTRLDNTLDLIMTNRPNQINRTHVLPGISDHDAVFTELDIKPSRKKQVPRKVPLYKKAGWPGLRQHVKLLSKTITDHGNNI